MQFATPLSAAAWIALAMVPLGIVALYFLKLRRRPVQVPSTLLWRRSMEDLHVNSLFQRLRRNLLLFLQLLAIALAMLALAGPRFRTPSVPGQRHILAIDTSASMRATDVTPTRLTEAKRRAAEVIRSLDSGSLAMIIAFSDRARVVTSFTGNTSALLRSLEQLEASEGTTSLRDALEVASGLANPASDLAAREGRPGTEAMSRTRLYLFTDGGFPDVGSFSVGQLEPEVSVIGPPPPPYRAPDPLAATPVVEPASDNVAILALRAARNEERPGQFQIFGRVRNYRDEPVATTLRLFLHDMRQPPGAGTLADAVELPIEPHSERSFQFDRPELDGVAGYEARLNGDDALPLDNRAFVVFQPARQARVLIVGRPNRYLSETLDTQAMRALCSVQSVGPDQLANPDLASDLLSGRYDLVIYDGVRPDTMPEANTLSLGAIPPIVEQAEPRVVDRPVILDWDLAHPLLRYIRDLNLVRIARAQVVELPPGATPLIESEQGPIAFIRPRRGFLDAVVGFAILDGDKFNTDWPTRSYSFPLFMFNAIQTLGNAGESGVDASQQPGQPVVLRGQAAAPNITVVAPDGRAERLRRSAQGAFIYHGANQTGLYRVQEADRVTAFAVNLFDPRESDLATRGLVPAGTPPEKEDEFRIKIGYTAVAGNAARARLIQDWWKPLAILALVVVLLEWYIYNRRVYV